MKARTIALILFSLAVSLSALEWSEFTMKSSAGGFGFRGMEKNQISFYSSTKQAENLRAKLHNDHLELNVLSVAPKELVKVRFHLFHKQPISGQRMELKLAISSSSGKSSDLLVEGWFNPPKSSQKKHFWKKTTRPLAPERIQLAKIYDFPEGLNEISIRLDFKEPGVYRIYDISLATPKPASTGLEPGKNYILNGGAERDWYGTAGLNDESSRMHDSGKIEISKNRIYEKLLKIELDEQEKVSGQRSFRLHTPQRGLGDGVFFLNPVPFAVGESAYLSVWMKADRKCRVTYGLFLANGIAYNKYASVGQEWKKYEFPIPIWGKPAPGAFFYGNPAHGYSSTVPYCMPQFNVPENATVWIDNVYYSVGVSNGEYKERPVTASAKINKDTGIYRPGEPIQGTLTIRNTTDKEQKTEIQSKMLNFLGEELPDTRQSNRITLQPKETKKIAFEHKPHPELRGAVNIIYEVNGETTGIYFGVLDSPEQPDARLGINIQEGNIKKTISFLKEFRIGTVRIWGGFRDWHYFGFRYAKPLHDAKIRSLFVLGTPPSVNGVPLKSETLLPKDRSVWFEELSGHIKQHKGEIAIYEFLNEFNIWRGRMKNPDPTLYDDPTPEVYLKGVEEFRKMLKLHDPKAQVAGPATCGTDVSFIHNLLRIGAGKYLDMITEHSYRQLPECPDYEDDLKTLKNGAKNYGNFRFAQTEAGHIKLPHLPDNLIEKYERRKASWDVRNMLIGWANGFDHYSHFMMSVVRSGCDWGVVHLGNGDNNYEPRPSVALFAYRAAADRINGASCVKRVRLGTNYRCYIFDRGNARVAALWKWNGKADQMHISPNLRKNGIIYDFMGTKRASQELTLGEFPYYIETSASAEELEREILASQVKESGSPFVIEAVPVNENQYIIKITNQSSTFFSGSIRINGAERSFRNLPPEETATMAFNTSKPISIIPQTIEAEINLTERKIKEKQKLDLRGAFVPRTSKTIVPDGDLSDWPANSEAIPLKVKGKLADWNSEYDSVRAETKIAWDDEYLYLAVTAWKKGHFPAESTGSLWKGDGIQVAFDTTRNATPGQIGYQDDDFEYDIALYRDTPLVYRSRASAASYDSLGKAIGVIEDVRCGIRILSDRIVYEMAFPKSCVSPFRLKNGSSMRLNVLLNIAGPNGRVGYLQVTPGIGDSKSPSEFIDIILATDTKS